MKRGVAARILTLLTQANPAWAGLPLQEMGLRHNLPAERANILKFKKKYLPPRRGRDRVGSRGGFKVYFLVIGCEFIGGKVSGPLINEGNRVIFYVEERKI
jgi:hypothetical protein